MPVELETSAAAPKQVSAPSDLFSSPRKRTFILSLLLVLITLGLYNQVSHNQFVNFDDNLYITSNPNIQHGINKLSLHWAFTSLDQANWHPLTWISHTIDWSLFGKNAGGHHYVSVLFHALDAVLLFLLLQSATGFTWRSLFVAALFAIHPVNVESVAWAAERKNVLSLMFFLLAMLAYGWYVRKPSIRRYSLVPLLFALGLMAKPQIITLPFVLLLWDYWPLRRFSIGKDDELAQAAPASFRWLLIEKLPLFLLAAVDSVITMRAQRAGLAVRTFGDYSLYARLGNCIVSYARYVGHAFWPFYLSPTYGHPGDALPVWQVVAASIFVLVASVLVLLSRKRYLIVGWLWFLGTLFPMIGIVQVGDQAMADRYAYIPFIGLFWMAVWSLGDAATDWHISPRWLAAPAALSLLVAGFLTHRLVGYWHDSEKLWDYALTINSNDFMAHANRGRVMVLQGRTEEAITEFSLAERLHRYPLTEVLRFADYELRNGHAEDAAERCRGVLQLTQDRHLRAVAYTDLGVADLKLNRLSEAKTNFDSALQSDPNVSEALLGMGLLCVRQEDLKGSVNYFSRSIQAQPSDIGYFLLAIALDKSGRSEEAHAAYAEAQRNAVNMDEVIQLAHQLIPQ